jgi:hypothetical protein
MAQFTAIANEKTINYLLRRIGDTCAAYDQYLFNLMRQLSPSYDGGLWVVHEYRNGAFAYVLPESKIEPQVRTYLQRPVSCSLEAISIAANLIVLGALCSKAMERGDEAGANCFDLYYHGLLNALRGNGDHIIERNQLRLATDTERAQTLVPHPELNAILAIID